MSDIFLAIADPKRREILEALEDLDLFVQTALQQDLGD